MSNLIAAQFETPFIAKGTYYSEAGQPYGVVKFPITLHNHGIKHNEDQDEFILTDLGLYRLSFNLPTNDDGAFSVYFLINGKLVENSPLFTPNFNSTMVGELLYDNKKAGTKVQLYVNGTVGLAVDEPFGGNGTLMIAKVYEQKVYAEYNKNFTVAVAVVPTSPLTPLSFDTEVINKKIVVDSTKSYFTLDKHGLYRLSFTMPSFFKAPNNHNQLQFFANNKPVGPVFDNSRYSTAIGEYLFYNHKKGTQISLVLLQGQLGFLNGTVVNGNITIELFSDDNSHHAAQYVTDLIPQDTNLLTSVTSTLVAFPNKTLNHDKTVKVSADGLYFTLRKKGLYRLSFYLPSVSISSSITYAQLYANGAAITNSPVFTSSSVYGGIYGELLYNNDSRDTQISLSVTGTIGLYSNYVQYGNGTILFEKLN